MKHLYIVIVFILSYKNSFSQTDSRKLKEQINENLDYSTKLKFNGFYSVSNQSDSMIYESLFFFNNNEILYARGYWPYNLMIRFMLHNTSLYERKASFFSWGTYSIKGSEINATLRIRINHVPPAINDNSFYQGTILNKDEIINWRPIPPFAKNREGQKGYPIDKSPVNLKFRYIENKNRIDSSKAWINKFRKKK